MTGILLLGQVIWERRRDALELLLFTLGALALCVLFIVAVVAYDVLVHG